MRLRFVAQYATHVICSAHRVSVGFARHSAGPPGQGLDSEGARYRTMLDVDMKGRECVCMLTRLPPPESERAGVRHQQLRGRQGRALESGSR